MSKMYQLFCDACSYKRITDGSDVQDLKEIKTSPIPRGAPQIDPEAPKVTTPVFGAPAVVTGSLRKQPDIKQKKRFKCPDCGRVITAYPIKKEDA